MAWSMRGSFPTFTIRMRGNDQMSASSKKKLRKEQNAAQLTAKQQQEKAAAKKLRIQTIAFVCAIALVIAVVVGTLAVRAVDKSGIFQNNTIAAVVGDHKITATEFNYFYCDLISEQYNNWSKTYGDYTSSYVSMLYGLDVTKSLDSQTVKETGKSWADTYVESALEQAKSTYALYDAALAANYELPADAKEEYDGTLEVFDMYGNLYGTDAEGILTATYGNGATMESFKEYLTAVFYAKSFASDYAEALTYDEEVFRNHEKDKEYEYSSYSFASYHISYEKFPELGTKGENDKVTFTDEQKEAALAEAKKAAETLTAATSVEDMDKLIAALPFNADNKSAIASKADDVLYSELNESLRDWLADPARQEGDTVVLPNTTTTEKEDGTETTVTNGYFALFFRGENENLRPLANVRHLLVAFEGGTTGEDGTKTYSDAEKQKAKDEAEKLLAEWKDGNANEESFIELVKKNSDDASKDQGGLYEDVSPASNLVDSFKNWSLDESRKPGDVEIIESEYGYHIMFYSSHDEMSYRDSMIYAELQEADYTKWYDGIVDVVNAELKTDKYVNKDIVMAQSAMY